MSVRNEESDPRLLELQEALAGRYSLQRELGRGGMGVVYLAREVMLDRPVAVKVLPPELAAQGRLRERFMREARTAAQLSHPHIVPVHAVDQVGDFVFFAMAFVEGRTLGDRIREDGPLPVSEAARILKEVAWALSYAHAQGVVHRDVKPDNILLEAGTGRALVTDFGIAKATGPGPALTGATDVLGTAEYMSPEQASGEPVDGRSDLYSLGVVGHFALSGRLPFTGNTVAATLAQHLTRPAPSLRTVAPEVPSRLAAALDRCLEKDPERRFEDGEQLAAAVDNAVERPAAVPAPIRRFLEEAHAQPVGMAIIGGYGLAVVGATIVAFATGGDPVWEILPITALGAAMAASPPGVLIRHARRLLRSGHAHDEVVRVLHDEVEERRRAFAGAGDGEPSRLDRWLKRLSIGGFAAWAAGFAWLGWGPFVESPLFWDLFGAGMVITPFVAIGASVGRALRGSPGKKARGERWLRFWQSRPGRWIFRLASTGLDRVGPTLGPGYRPTSVALSMAADRLFRDLPKELQREFHILPEVVSALEADAERTRADIEKLDRARADAGDAADLAAEIQAARDAADARLKDVIGALESIRVQLIRLHAGIGSPERLTEDLGNARALAEDIGRVAHGAREVDRLLRNPGPAAATGLSDTPPARERESETPAPT